MFTKYVPVAIGAVHGTVANRTSVPAGIGPVPSCANGGPPVPFSVVVLYGASAVDRVTLITPMFLTVVVIRIVERVRTSMSGDTNPMEAGRSKRWVVAPATTVTLLGVRFGASTWTVVTTMLFVSLPSGYRFLGSTIALTRTSVGNVGGLGVDVADTSTGVPGSTDATATFARRRGAQNRLRRRCSVPSRAAT